MPISWETLVSALESAPGSFFYVLLLLLLLSSSALWLQKRAQPARLDWRISLGLVSLMALRSVEAIVFGMFWFAVMPLPAVAAPLERSIHLISIIVFTWLWSRQNGERRSQQALIAAELFAALAISLVLILPWMGSTTSFNYTGLDYAWGAACFVALALGWWQIYKSKQSGSQAGLVQFVILFLGQIIHLLLAEPFGNMPLATQAADLLTLPILFLLPAKQAAQQPKTVMEAEYPIEEPMLTDHLAREQDEAVQASFDFDTSPHEKESGPASRLHAEELARDTAHESGADFCAFATLSEESEQLELRYGYYARREGLLESVAVPLPDVPRLASAVKKGRTLRLSADQRLAELDNLAKVLKLPFSSHLMAVRIPNVGDALRWVVLLVRLDQPWQFEDEVKLEKSIEELGAKLTNAIALGAPQETIPIEAAPPEPEGDELAELEAENEWIREDTARPPLQSKELKPQSPFKYSPATLQTTGIVQALQMENEQIQSAVSSLESSGGSAAPVSREAQQAKEELRLALEEIATLQARLDEAQKGPVETSAPRVSGRKMADNQVEVIASIAQELRQPLSSILGYTDLLLSESVGILGALQRKFLERVRSSTERINALIGDLIRIAELDRAGLSAQRKPVDLSTVIDDAIGQLRNQLQEKRIALRVDLPSQLPELNTDRDALQQILYHLLQNADAATPSEGAITLRAVIDSQSEFGDFVLLQVSDSGGGIPDEDLPRVFSRVYRASNPVIKGVGDTGVGLTIAETLTQALGGRIWVESEAGVGATFSVLLPLQLAPK